MTIWLRTFFLGICLLLSGISVSQAVSLSDSIRKALNESPVIRVKLDMRGSFVTGQSARMGGIKAGLGFGETLTIGVGYNWLMTDIIQDLPDVPGEAIESTVFLRYFAPYVEYTFYHKKNWAIRIPVQVGFGYSGLKHHIGDPGKVSNTGAVLLYEPSMIAEFMFLKYFGIGAGAGYRLMLLNNKNIDHQFSSPIYHMKFTVNLGKIYKDIVRSES